MGDLDTQSVTDTGSEDLQMGVQDRLRLWKWRLRDGGERLPQFAQNLPHLLETEMPSISSLQGLHSTLLKSKEMANEVKQLQMEYIFSKQQADLLQQERDLLKWHNANNSKILHIKRNELTNLRQKNVELTRKLKEQQKENDRQTKEQNNLALEVAKYDQESTKMTEERDAQYSEFMQWLERRNDFLLETTAERRLAANERKKRSKQLQRLHLAVNRDKRAHVRVDGLKELENLAVRVQEGTKTYKERDFQKASDVTGPQREAILQIIQSKLDS